MIQIYHDIESLSRAAAEIFVVQSQQAIKDNGRFSVALSGGHTPTRTYELLAQQPFRDQVQWLQVHIFWGDERCVLSNDSRSNERTARQALLDHVPIPKEQIYPIHCSQEPHQTAENYEKLLRNFFTGQSHMFDLVFLGLGENGHTASLFPYSPILDERKRWSAEVYVAEENLYRVTLTAPLINQAALVAFLVAGATKARVLKEVLEGPWDPSCLPAQLIRPKNSNLYWLVDKKASSLVNHIV